MSTFGSEAGRGQEAALIKQSDNYVSVSEKGTGNYGAAAALPSPAPRRFPGGARGGGAAMSCKRILYLGPGVCSSVWVQFGTENFCAPLRRQP